MANILTVHGNTYRDDAHPTQGMDNGGFRTRLFPMLSDTLWEIDSRITAGQGSLNSIIATATSDFADSVAAAATSESQAEAHKIAAADSATAAAASAASAFNAPGTQATSVTSLTIGTGSKTITLQQTGKAFTPGQWVNLLDSANPAINWMAGAITAFNGGTGETTINVVTTGGAGTLASWVVVAASATAETPAFGGRSARTSNTALAGADLGKLIDITSGTWTQTFTAAATLGANWYCYLRNAGSGDITLDPAGSELIDGKASYVMYPGETRLVTCDGVGFYTIVLTSFYRVFTATELFYRPPGYNRIQGLMWGAGGGGAGGYGGNGGSCVPFDLRASDFADSQTFTVGAGGAVGADGGASTVLTITTGSAGKGNTYGSYGYGRDYVSGPIAPNRIGGAYNFTQPIYADYGGGRGLNTAGSPASLAHSIFGAGGGVVSGTPGTSVFGGQGGVGAGAGTAPGGGGGSTGPGARGEIRTWGVI